IGTCRPAHSVSGTSPHGAHSSAVWAVWPRAAPLRTVFRAAGAARSKAMAPSLEQRMVSPNVMLAGAGRRLKVIFASVCPAPPTNFFPYALKCKRGSRLAQFLQIRTIRTVRGYLARAASRPAGAAIAEPNGVALAYETLDLTRPEGA